MVEVVGVLHLATRQPVKVPMEPDVDAGQRYGHWNGEAPATKMAGA